MQTSEKVVHRRVDQTSHLIAQKARVQYSTVASGDVGFSRLTGRCFTREVC